MPHRRVLKEQAVNDDQRVSRAQPVGKGIANEIGATTSALGATA